MKKLSGILFSCSEAELTKHGNKVDRIEDING